MPSASSQRQSRTTSSIIRLASWTGAWLVTMALAAFGPEFLWDSPALSLTALLVNLGCGIGMIRANVQHLNVLDEVMQKIQLHAMGLSLGVGIVGGISYSLLDTTNLISSDAEIAGLIMLIAISYLFSVIIALKRHE